MKEEWKEFLLDDSKEYTLEQFIEKFKQAVDYLHSKHMRIGSQMLTERRAYDLQFHLDEIEKEYYTRIFEKEGYALKDCKKIVEVMDALYHMLDISKEEASCFALYIADNHLTLSAAIEEKYGLSIAEYEEYLEKILEPYVDYCVKKIFRYGKELFDILLEVFEETSTFNGGKTS